MASTRRKVPDEKSDKKDVTSSADNAFWEKVYRATKVIFTGLLFLLVLCSAVVSKGCLLILTWNILAPSNGTEHQLKTFEGHFGYTDNSLNVSSISDTETNVYYVWALFMLVTTPYVWSVIVCIWKLLSKKPIKTNDETLDKNPKRLAWSPWLQFVVAILPAILHSVGLSTFVFILLPSVDPLSGLWYCSSATLVPSIVQIVFSSRKTLVKKKGSTFTVIWPFVARISCLVLSVTSLIFWTVFLARASGTSRIDVRLTLSILSPILMSFGWWENFVPDKQSVNISSIGENCSEISDTSTAMDTHRKSDDTPHCLKVFKEQINMLKDHSFTGRHIIYAIVYTCKLIITFAMMASIYGRPCLLLAFNGDENPVIRSSEAYGSTLLHKGENCSTSVPFVIALIGIATGYSCHRFSMAAVKIVSQVVNFSLPVILVSPVTAVTLVILSMTSKNGHSSCDSPFPSWEKDGTVDNLGYMLVASMTGYISLLLLTTHIWTNKIERMKKGHEIFLKPLYCGALVDQSLLLNRRQEKKFLDKRGNVKKDTEARIKKERDKDATPVLSDAVPMLYLCATMWHEDDREMKQLLKSLFSMDADQRSRIRSHSDFYKMEAHIFFDDAFEENCNCVNQYVKTFIEAVEPTARSESPDKKTVKPFRKTATPYGGRLTWTLPEGNKLIAHLKDKAKIRPKKRWSQVMYMYYFLSHILGVEEEDFEKKKDKAKNKFILALDGDVDFRPSAVKLLVDRMKRNPEVGAACGRIHPIGSGAVVWYQKFEYAISHWLVKATEHVAGCVLCSPGCFSLFRGSALMGRVMQEYTTLSTEARHYIQYDQGEDRWLCTLLLKNGYKVDYCAASDAYTFAPESFKVFYNQRRRWTPSTLANIMDLLASWRDVIRTNNYVSLPYIVLHLFWFTSSLVTPGVLILTIVGGIDLAYSGLSLHASLLINLIPVALFVLVCLFANSDFQISVAAALSIMYSLVMVIVLIGLIRKSVEQGFCSISTPFFLGVIGIFVITGIMHPQEISCLIHGMLFFISIPSTSILLMIYSIVNMNNVSWGTRENTQTSADGSAGKAEKNLMQQFMEQVSCYEPTNIAKKEDNKKEMQGDHDHDGYFDLKTSNKQKKGKKKENEFWEWLIRTYLYPDGKIGKTSVGNIKGIEEVNVKQKSLDEAKKSRYEEFMKNKEQRESDNDSQTGIFDENSDKSKLEEDERLREEREETIRKKEADLKNFRNKTSLVFFLINVLSMVIVFYLQQVNADTAGELSIQLTCSDGGSLSVEPISMTFTVVFGLLLIIQFICMIVHRCKTFLQIISITKIRQDFNVEQQCPAGIAEQARGADEPETTLFREKNDGKKIKRKRRKNKNRIGPEVMDSNDDPEANISYEGEVKRPQIDHRFVVDSERNSQSKTTPIQKPKLKAIDKETINESRSTIIAQSWSQQGLRPASLPAIGNSNIPPVHT